jgi:membrane-bound metal-dependent hydrolase YbcI (DUF457 family)
MSGNNFSRFIMPLPIGHAVIGFTTQSLFGTEESRSGRWKALLGILILSNLPDVDVLLGIVFHGNGNVFHRGPTHSLIFALIGGFLATRVLRLWSQLPKFSFRICFLFILSHVVADLVFTSSPVSFFWPITVNWSNGYIELRHVVNLVLFGNYRDAEIIIGCVLFIILHRTLLKFGTIGYERFIAAVSGRSRCKVCEKTEIPAKS